MATVKPAAALDIDLGAVTKESELVLKSRARNSIYDGVVGKLRELAPGQSITIKPKDKKVLEKRDEHTKLRNRMAAVAKRAATGHPKGFTFSVLMTADGVALVARKGE